MKHSSNGKFLSTTMLSSGALLLFAALPGTARADDLPAGGVVAAGTATIGSNGQTTTVNQSSGRAVINWDSFSVSQGKTVAFVQPDAQSATLNRVTGSTSSTIAGQILSNGAVYLVNPNGIAITATGTVQTGGGFVASTLGMADANFMAGNARFTGGGSSAPVSNAGHITAGQGAYVALLGGSVANSGTIAVPLGRVGLGSGESITLDLNGDGFMQVAVPTSALTGDAALISHSGSISASGGYVVLEAATVRDAVRNVINLSGDINADSAFGTAGNIRLLGGDGGTVTVSGTLSAQAVGGGGHSGLVETSGANFDFTGLRVLTLSRGGFGTWLIDSTDLTVDAGMATAISANLAMNNVTLQTNIGGTSIANGDINFNVDGKISWFSTSALTFSAYRDVNINGGIVGGESASLNIRADNTGTGNGSLYLGASSYITNQRSPGSAFRIAIFYNPVSYSNPTDFSNHISTNSGYLPIAYMLVNNVDDLQNINQNLNGSYALGKDIDASSTASWNGGAGFIPIGTDGLGTILNAGLGFVGHFNGNYYTIGSLAIARPNVDDVGLFGAVWNNGGFSSSGIADFQNIKLVNGNITGHSNVGGVFGSVGSIGSLTSSQINLSDIGFTGSVTGGGTNIGGVIGAVGDGPVLDHLRSSGSVTGNSYVGGLIGTMSALSLTNSYSSSDVVGSHQVGGLAGGNSNALTEGVYATGNVTGFDKVGGLFGYSTGTLSVAYSTGSITAPSGYSVGGLIGFITGTTVHDVYSTSNITAPNGLAVGGIAGLNYESPVYRSYYAGTINSPNTNSVGALSGELVGYHNFFLNSFWDTAIIGPDAKQAFGFITVYDVSTVAGLTTNQLQDFNTYSATYTNWDFASIWSPPTQAGQAGQTAGYYPQLYALTPVVVASAANATRAYGAVNPDFAVTITSGAGYHGAAYVFQPVGGDALYSQSLVSATLTQSLSVGQYGILRNTATGSGGVVYRVIDATGGTLSVTPAPLTITYTADPFSRLYGAANPAFTGAESITGLVNGDTFASVTTGTASYGTIATSGSNVGSYAITGSGLAANSSNYSFTFAQAAGNATALTITPAALTITYTADPFSRFYGAADPIYTGTQSAIGLVNGDTLAAVTTGTANYATNATSGSGTGSYAINGSGLVANSGNYRFTFAQAAGNATALTITPAALSVVADPLSRTYGAANPALTYAATGLVNGDTLSGGLATSATTASSAGSYGITQGSLAASANYALSFTGALLTINPAALTITYTADPFSRLYGNANPALTGTQSATGLVNGDTLAGVTTGTASYATSATSGSNVGSYAITGSGLAANSGNYSFTFAQAAGNARALTITPRPLSVTADPLSRQFGFPNPPLTYVVGPANATSGLVNGDVLTGALSTTATVSSPSGDYAILQGSLAASANYTLNYTGALLKIALPPLQSLSSFVPTPASDQAQMLQPDVPKGCTNDQVSGQIRETGKAGIDTSGGASCN